MKTNFSRFGRSAVSVVLSAIMLLSTVIVNAETINVDSVSEAAASDTVTVDITPDDVTQTVMDVEDVRANSEDDSAAAESVKNDEEESQPDAAEVKTEDVKADTAVQANSKKSEKKALEASGASFTKGSTIYFIDNLGWGNAQIHPYNSGTDYVDKAMTKVTGTTNLYYYTFAKTYANVIFRDVNGAWTAEKTSEAITMGSNKVFYLSDTASTQTGDSNGRRVCNNCSFTDLGITDSASIESNDHTVSTKTIYFNPIDYGWNNCYAHYWFDTSISGVDISLSAWPGVEMTPTGTAIGNSNSQYSINLPSIANRVIFLRKKSDGTVKYRTGNVTLSDDTTKNIFIPENSNFLDGDTENKVTNGYWMSEDEYNQSLNATKTVYVDTSASWNVNTAAAYYGKPDGTWIQTALPTTATDNEGISTITIEGGYDKVIFTKDTNWGSGGNENKTFAVPLVGHDSNMCFYVTDTVSNNLSREDNGTNLTATRTGYWGKPAQYWPDTADLVGTGTNATTKAYMYWSNSDDGFAKSENNGSYSDTPNKKIVQQINDTSGNTWYYVDFTNAEVGTNLYFGLADSSGTPLNNTRGIKVSLSNSFVLGYGVQEKNQFWFGKTWTLKRVETLRIYVNSLDNTFYRYSVVPVSSVTAKSVNVIAKDGTLRNNFKKYADLGDTKIVEIGGNSTITTESSGTYKIGSTYIYDDYPYNNHNYAQTAVIDKGTTIKIRTTIASDDPNKEDAHGEKLVEKYYVKAFNINGETVWPTTKGVQSNGVYECEYTIPSSYTGENIEITPVYYYNESLNSSRKYINFIVENFNGAVVDEWGRKVNKSAGTPILACYAWYGHGHDEASYKATDKPALGGYPGQPMVYENGHYTMQVPVTIDDGSHIQGITLNNYVWDFVHADTQGAGNDGQRESINCQTYDYDDFVVLSYANPAPEFIAFRFKYETTNNQNTGVVTTTRTSGNTPQPYGNLPTDSDLDYSSYTEASSGNGWETPYEDYYGNTIDLFNNILKKKDGTVVKTEYEENFNDQPFYVVSDGYRDIYYGHFTTLWYVYDSNKKFVGKIPSSALYYEPTPDEPMPTTLATNVAEIPSWFLPWRANTTYNITNDRNETNDQEKLEYWTTYYYLYWGGKTVGSSTTVSALNHTAEITYETAIRAQDTNAKAPGKEKDESDKHPRDPGLRNDGQWYHSKSGVTFDAEIVIKYWDNTLNDGEGGWVTDTISASGDNPRAGTVTGAHAYFTNKTYTPTGGTTINFPGYLQYTAAGVQTSSDSFQFEANQYSQGVVTSGSTTKQMYKFDGWYVEIDGVESPLTTVLNDDKAMSSTADMRGYTKLVAKYKPYDETITPSGEYLEISHNLYKDAVKFANSPAVLNGTGTPKITVQVFDGNTEIDNIPYIVDNATNTVKVDKAYLEAYKNATLKVTLKTEPDSNNTYENTYLKTVDEVTEAGATGVKGYEEPAGNGTATYPTDAAWTVESKATNPETNVGTIVYTTTISGLLETEGETTSLKTNNIKFYTQLSTTTINVVLKYYDRKVSNSTPLDIDTKATEITKTVSVSGTTLEKAVGTATTDLISNKKIDNDIDEYTFWASLSEASGTNGIADLTRPNGSGTYSESIYHTDYYARQPGEGNFDNEDQAKWVTYLDANGVEIKTAEFNEDTDNVATYAATYDENAQTNIKRVSTVVVWGYNSPKTYQMTFNTENVVYDTNAELYLATGVKSDFNGMPFYYNERVGELKDSNSSDSTELVDKVSDHLAAYGISQKSDATKVYAEAQANVNVQGTTETKYFDGWYELVNGSYVKVSSDPVYGNRVTKSATLYAGYNNDTDPNDENATVNKGITVTANDVEKYVVGDTDYIRYTTVLNSYGFDDSDPNFKSASVVYVRLGEDVNYSDTVDTLLGYNVSNGSGTLKDDIIEQLNADKSKGRTAIAVTVTITSLDLNAKTVIYSYDVIPTVTDKGDEENYGKTAGSGQIQFTNKNRTQFSMNLPVSAVETGGSCTNLVVFAAVKYENTDTNAAFPGSFTADGAEEYIASDNYIIYKNGAAVNNNN